MVGARAISSGSISQSPSSSDGCVMHLGLIARSRYIYRMRIPGTARRVAESHIDAQLQRGLRMSYRRRCSVRACSDQPSDNPGGGFTILEF